MPSDHPATFDAERLLSDCDVAFTRRSGPGGQHRNKVATCVVLTHRPTGVRAEAGERRSQSENRAAALRRLRVRLAVDVRAAVSEPHEPSDLWKSRVRNGRIACNPAHDDFPALLAEALDVAVVRGGDLRAASEEFGCTPSQLARFFKDEPAAFAKLNAVRTANGLHALK